MTRPKEYLINNYCPTRCEKLFQNECKSGERTRCWDFDETLKLLEDFISKENGFVWHDLREDPTDLPKRDERFSTNISVPVLTQTSGFAFYQFDDKKWYYQGKVVDVIAWCEIPQFKE